MGDYVDFQNGYAFKSSDYTEEGHYLIRIKNVQQGFIEINDKCFVKIPNETKFEKFKLKNGDIVVSLTGNVGRIARIKDEHLPAVLNQRVASVAPKDTKVLGEEYLYYLLRTPEFFSFAIGSGKGAAQQNISTADMEKFEARIPSLEKQRKIVEKLDKAFAEIDSLEKNLQLKEEKTNQLLQSMFNTALNNDKFEKKVVTLDQISENLDNQRIPITREVRTVGKYPYYGASGIIDYVEDYIFEGDALLVSEDGANLLARSTPIAFSVTGKYWVNNHAHILRFKDQYLQEYVKHFLENTNLDKFVTGAAQPKLTQRALNNIPIKIPLNQLDVKKVSEGLSKLKELTFLIMVNFVLKRKLADELKSAFLSKYFGQQDLK